MFERSRNDEGCMDVGRPRLVDDNPDKRQLSLTRLPFTATQACLS